MNVSQKFQEVEIDLTSNSSSYDVQESLLSGERISFTVTDNSNQKKFVFSGEVKGDKIEGVVQIHEGKNKNVEDWTAVLE
jgi:hypothetical protein